MPKAQIVINVQGGIVQDVFASLPDLDVIVVDWDGEGVDPRSPHMVEIATPYGSDKAFVVDFPVEPLSQLAGTEVEQAIDAAYASGVLDDFVGEPTC